MTIARLENCLKTLYLCFKYGGLQTYIYYIDLTISTLNVCYSIKSTPFISNLQEDVNYKCIQIFLDENSYKSSVHNQKILLDVPKLCQKLKLPAFFLSNNILLSCSSNFFKLLWELRLIKNYTDKVKNAHDICVKNRKHFSFDEDYNNAVQFLIQAQHLSEAMAVLSLKDEELIPERENWDDCPVLTLPSLQVQQPQMKDLMDFHMKYLRSIEVLREKCPERSDHLNSSIRHDINALLIEIKEQFWNNAQFQNFELFKSLKCLVSDLLRINRYDFFKIAYQGFDIDVLSEFQNYNEYLFVERNNFESLLLGKVLSDQSAEGVVWTLKLNTPSVHIDNIPLFAIMKYSKLRKYPNSVHELAVGIEINKLRKFVPNFMYTLGGFLCSPPSIKKLKSMDPKINNTYNFSSLCTTTNREKLEVMVLSEVVPAKYDFHNFLKKEKDEKEISKILIQIFYALYIAFRELQFIHGDLHSENILIDETKPTVIDMNLKNGSSFNLTVSKIPVIIDYGYASLKPMRLSGRLTPLKEESLLSEPVFDASDIENPQNYLAIEDTSMIFSVFDYDKTNYLEKFFELKGMNISEKIENLYQRITNN